MISSVSMIKEVVWLLSLFYANDWVYSLSLGAPCVTPNGEEAKCIPVNSCKVIKITLFQRTDTAIRFARVSFCGFHTDKNPLVCCGSNATFSDERRFFDLANSNNNSVLSDRNFCGYQKKSFKLVLYGGQSTEIDDHPWTALLSYLEDGFSSFKCGGTLINKRYVLTAAHCVVTPSSIILDSVRLGEWRISTKRDCFLPSLGGYCADPVIDVKIEKTIVHPQYRRSTASNDIALLRLASNVEYSDYVRPICLPSPDAESSPVGVFLTVVGWGATENSSSSDYKLELNVPVVDHQACNLKFRKLRPITENQLCAGGVKGQDSCDGDSGGPLLKRFDDTRHRKAQWYQEGIVSWGLGCGHPGYFGVYTRVSKYINWITDNIAE